MIDLPYRPEVDPPPELLADLYDHRPLVITPDYIGVERRSARLPRRAAGTPRPRLHVGQIVATALVTTAVVLSLGLVSRPAPAHALPASSTAAGLSTAQSQRHALRAAEQLARAQQREAATSARAANHLARAQQRQATATARAERQAARSQNRSEGAQVRTAMQATVIRNRLARVTARDVHQLALVGHP